MIIVNPSFREIGVGIMTEKKTNYITQNFGIRRVPRLAGGVVFEDANGNGFYDIGEGIGGITVSDRKTGSVKSWPSGAYTLASQEMGC